LATAERHTAPVFEGRVVEVVEGLASPPAGNPPPANGGDEGGVS
jgi:hypothetical protein